MLPDRVRAELVRVTYVVWDESVPNANSTESLPERSNPVVFSPELAMTLEVAELGSNRR